MLAQPRLKLTCAAIALVGVVLGHLSQREADALRRQRSDQLELLVIPSPSTLRAASLGYHVHLADLVWMRAVLEFGASYDQEPDATWQSWFARMIEASLALDPHWRTPPYYGGVMLRIMGNRELSTEIFKQGALNHPEDPYFPFSVGMNYYFDEDYEQAADWVARAGELPGAPDWYSRAAVTFRQRGRSPEDALHYLEDELADTTNPQLRDSLLHRIAEVQHELLSIGLTEAVASFTEHEGHPPARLARLAELGLVNFIPEEPLGGDWVLDVDGVVRSTVQRDQLIDKALRQERKMLRSRAALEPAP